jgi:hypothetical protein
MKYPYVIEGFKLSLAEASGRKRFFFEKKNQKTFVNWRSLNPDRPKPKGSEVFWFFFSRKNILPTQGHHR